MKKIILMFAILSLMAIALTGCLGAGTIYNEAGKTAQDSVEAVDTLYKEMFNSRFQMYFGDEVKGSYVIGVLDIVSVNNGDEANPKVNLTYKSLDGERITNFDNKTAIDKTKKYKLEASKYDNNGLITEITITELAK